MSSTDEVILESGFLPEDVRIEPSYDTNRENKRYRGVLIIHVPTGTQVINEETESELTNVGLALGELTRKLAAQR